MAYSMGIIPLFGCLVAFAHPPYDSWAEPDIHRLSGIWILFNKKKIHLSV